MRLGAPPLGEGVDEPDAATRLGGPRIGRRSTALGLAETAVRDQDPHDAVGQAEVQADRGAFRGVQHGVGHQLAHDELRRFDLLGLDVPGGECLSDERPGRARGAQRGHELECRLLVHDGVR